MAKKTIASGNLHAELLLIEAKARAAEILIDLMDDPEVSIHTRVQIAKAILGYRPGQAATIEAVPVAAQVPQPPREETWDEYRKKHSQD